MRKLTKSEILNSIKPVRKVVTLNVGKKSVDYNVTRIGVGHIMTEFGVFLLYHFEVDDKWKEYNVLVKSDIGKNYQPIFFGNKLHVRIDSGCLTGHIFNDQTCECRSQLFESIKEISSIGEGIIICIPRQDGRGMGIPFKLVTLSLQYCFGYDTVQAAKTITKGGEIDKRDYFGAISILKFFGVKKGSGIDLLTNNPSKIAAFENNHYFSIDRCGLVIKPNKYTKKHLLAKQTYLGHLGLIQKISR